MTLIIDRFQANGRAIGRNNADLLSVGMRSAVRGHFLPAFAAIVQNESICTHEAQHHVGQNQGND